MREKSSMNAGEGWRSQSIPHHISFCVRQIETKEWNKSKLNLWDQIILLCFMLCEDLHVRFLFLLNCILVFFVHLFYLHILSRVLPMMSILYFVLSFFPHFRLFVWLFEVAENSSNEMKQGKSLSTGERGNVLWF